MEAKNEGGRPFKQPIAPTKFGRWMARKGLTPRVVARALGVSPTQVYAWRRAVHFPRAKIRNRLIEMARGDLDLNAFGVSDPDSDVWVD